MTFKYSARNLNFKADPMLIQCNTLSIFFFVPCILKATESYINKRKVEGTT